MPSEAEATRRWLNDIAHNIALAETFVTDVTYEIFKADMMRLYAVTRCLEIISEASRRLPLKLKDRHPAIPWRDIAAAGNIYRHEYEGIDTRSLWTTATRELGLLRAVIVSELDRLNGLE